MAEVLNSVPDGWEVKALGEVSRIELGKTPSRSNSIYWDTEKQTGNVWLSISDLPKQNLAVASDSKEYLSDEGASISKIVPRETLMVSFKLTLGRLAYAGKDLYTNEAIASLYLFNPNQFAENYLYYYLTFYDWDKAAEGKEKIKGKTLNKKILKELEILVPPLPEQERIVGVLDEAFEGIATATAQAEKNLQNARELFQSVLQSTFSQKGDDWVETTLGEVSVINYGYTAKANAEVVGPKFLRITDIQDGHVNWDTVPFCSLTEKEFKKHKLEKGDIVFARTGATTGKSFLLIDPPESVSASYLIRLRITDENLLPAYLRLFFQTEDYWRLIRDGTEGAAQGGFNASKLSKSLFEKAKTYRT